MQNEKEKICLAMFSPNQCRLVCRLQRTIGHEGKEDQARKADCCQRVAAQQLRAVIRRSANSTGR
jgi:hypothetical protein